MRILVTAGPTREHLDAIRFLSNGSSGKMGFACARAARKAGHRLTLVTGPVALSDPSGVRTLRVTSAKEMRRAVMGVYSRIDVVIMTAAVSDYQPAERFSGKLKKRAAARTLVGFALEVQDAEAQALLKYKKKNLDYVVLNSPRTFAADRMDAIVYRHGRAVKRFHRSTKAAVAAWIVRAIESAEPRGRYS